MLVMAQVEIIMLDQIKEEIVILLDGEIKQISTLRIHLEIIKSCLRYILLYFSWIHRMLMCL